MAAQSKTESPNSFTRFPDFIRVIKAANIANLERCYQCTTCSNGCPMATFMDYFPHQLIHMSLLGLKNRVLKSKAIWICTSCETCVTRCPNEVDIVRLMYVLRSEAIREGVTVPIEEIPKFHKVFLDEIRRRGRIHELQLVLRYKLRKGYLLSLKSARKDAIDGIKMLLKGKIKIIIPKMHRSSEVRKIFQKLNQIK